MQLTTKFSLFVNLFLFSGMTFIALACLLAFFYSGYVGHDVIAPHSLPLPFSLFRHSGYTVIRIVLVVAIILAILILLMLLLFACQIRRYRRGIEHLEVRAEKIIHGARGKLIRGSVVEWPPQSSCALDILLDDLQEASEQRIRIDTLIRAFAAQDAKTGLNNRLFFDNQLATLLEDPEKVGTHGVVMMIRLPDFDTFCECCGYQVVQDYLFSLINMLSTFVMRYPGALLARYFRCDFTVLLPHSTLKEAGRIASQLITAVDTLPPVPVIDRADMIHIGISAWCGGQSPQQVMENVEQATRHAVLRGGNNWSVGDQSECGVFRGSVKWRTLLEQTLHRGGPRLYQMPVVTRDGTVHHYEIVPRILDGDKALLSSEYMPLVQQMGLAERYDRQMIARMIALSTDWTQKTLALPLTVDALLQRSFLHWLRDNLLQCPRKQRKCFLFELAEADVCQHYGRLQPAFRLLYGLECQIVIYKAGLTVVSTAYIKQFGIELIKLDPGLVRHIDQRTENQLFVQSLLEVCKTTATQVFAAGVRSKKEWQTLAELGVAGGQGDLFATSRPVQTGMKKYSQRYRV